MPSLAHAIRRTVIEESMRAHVGHIGSALSIADMLAAVYGEVLPPGPDDGPERDRFVLSKGHAALALYAALAATGRLAPERVSEYCTDGTAVGVHPEHDLPGVDFSTGSLGQGLSIGAGAAFAARMQGSTRRAFVLMSDAEGNEGSVWEAAMFAAHHRLGNLVALVDVNGQQALGYTRDVLAGDLPARWDAFGWDVHVIDGHDVDVIASTIRGLPVGGPPHVLLCETTFGKGVSFMESKIEWHYLPLDEERHRLALQEIGA
jgi:transketolase